MQAGALRVGEYLRGAYATIPVDGFEVLEGEEQVFNLEVESEHRYLVGDSAVLAHNATTRSGKDCPSGIGGRCKQPGEALDSIGDGVDDELETVAAPHGQGSSLGKAADGVGDVAKSGTPITKRSMIEGFGVTNHAFRKSGLGRGATEELVASAISGVRSAGTITRETGA